MSTRRSRRQRMRPKRQNLLFAMRLKLARKRARMTMSDASRAAGIPRQRWHEYERGLAQPRLKTAKILATVVGVTVDNLITTQQESPDDETD